MSKEIYNLQIPIDKEMAEQLKRLASADDRSLRSYCRGIIKDYLFNQNYKPTIIEKTSEPEPAENNDIMKDYDYSFED